MIDNPQKAAQLLASLKQAVPFTVTLVPTLVNYLRDQRISIVEQTQHTVSGLSYAGMKAASYVISAAAETAKVSSSP